MKKRFYDLAKLSATTWENDRENFVFGVIMFILGLVLSGLILYLVVLIAAMAPLGFGIVVLALLIIIGIAAFLVKFGKEIT